MKQLLFISLSALILVSCSKIKKTQKQLSGEWNIYSYRIIGVDGLTDYYETEGTITFEQLSDSTFSYNENFVSQFPSGANTYLREGIGTFKEKNAEYFDLVITSPTGFTYEDSRIILITNDDLKLEHNDANGKHIFVLQKD
jgi:hypothetical protein